MINVVELSLENEMDLVLAHRRTMRVAEKLGLTVATQTTFATAVSEISRTVIEHTDDGILTVGLEQNKQRFALKATIAFDKEIKFTNADDGFYYAQKLVPEFNLLEGDMTNAIEMKIGLPRSLKLDPIKIALLKEYFLKEPPINAYEEIKKRNINLSKLKEEQEEELRQSKIVDEKKTEFISVASHELKTPITIIKAYTQIARRFRDECPPKVQELMAKIDDQSAKLLSLINQMLDLSKMENGYLQYSFENLTLNDYILNMLSVFRHIMPDHEIISDLCRDVTVNIDKLRMEQVFSNLLGNAAKYSAKNTTIHIKCTLAGDGFITVAVTDQGLGLSYANMQSVFEKFYRAKDVIQTHAGLGMGLFITSKIVTDHGGKIWVESVEGKGSTFFFTIPVTSV